MSMCTRRLTWLLTTSLIAALLAMPAGAAVAVTGDEDVTFTGTVETTWDYRYSWGEPAMQTDRLQGSATYTGLDPKAAAAQHYAADVSLSGSERRSYHPQECSEVISYQHEGPYGSDSDDRVALTLWQDEEGVHFVPQLVYLDSPYVNDCPGGSSGTVSSSTGGFAAGESWDTVLTDDTDPAPDRIVGSMTWTLSDPPAGRMPPAITAYSFTVTYDLTMNDACESEVFSSYDAFRPYADGTDEAWLQFDVATEWCRAADGDVVVLDVAPAGRLVDQPSLAEYLLADQVRFWFSYEDRWTRPPSHTVSGDKVTASGTFESCLGIPVIGKLKHLEKLVEGLRYLAKRIDAVEGKWAGTANKVAWAARGAARAVEVLLESPGEAARWAARRAIKLLGNVVFALPADVQERLTSLLLGVISTYDAKSPAAKSFLSALKNQLTGAIVGAADDLLGRLLQSDLCWALWKPRIVQTLDTAAEAGVAGEFVDRDGDRPWRVERHIGAF